MSDRINLFKDHLQITIKVRIGYKIVRLSINTPLCEE